PAIATSRLRAGAWACACPAIPQPTKHSAADCFRKCLRSFMADSSRWPELALYQSLRKRSGTMAKVSGAQVLAEMLQGYGVTHVFMVPAVLRRTFAEMERRTSIARIHTHGEKAAAYMADGYARASGRPGICMAQVVGALNLAAGLRDAWLAHSPVIAFT